jgi:hypothetical protein
MNSPTFPLRGSHPARLASGSLIGFADYPQPSGNKSFAPRLGLARCKPFALSQNVSPPALALPPTSLPLPRVPLPKAGRLTLHTTPPQRKRNSNAFQCSHRQISNRQLRDWVMHRRRLRAMGESLSDRPTDHAPELLKSSESTFPTPPLGWLQMAKLCPMGDLRLARGKTVHVKPAPALKELGPVVTSILSRMPQTAVKKT